MKSLRDGADATHRAQFERAVREASRTDAGRSQPGYAVYADLALLDLLICGTAWT